MKTIPPRKRLRLYSRLDARFDATVLGLVAGIGGLVVGKLRRRWYEELLENLEEEA